MKKEYIKPIIMIIKTCNDGALLQTVSLYDYDKRDPVETIAPEGDELIYDKDSIIWND